MKPLGSEATMFNILGRNPCTNLRVVPSDMRAVSPTTLRSLMTGFTRRDNWPCGQNGYLCSHRRFSDGCKYALRYGFDFTGSPMEPNRESKIVKEPFYINQFWRFAPVAIHLRGKTSKLCAQFGKNFDASRNPKLRPPHPSVKLVNTYKPATLEP